MAEAQKAMGTLLTYTDTATLIGGLKNIGGMALTQDELDCTSHETTGGYKEVIAGLRDGGTIDIEGFFDSTDGGQEEMYQHFHSDTDGGAESLTITYPDASTWVFDAIITNLALGDAPYDGVLGFTATLRVSGQPTFSEWTVGS